MGFPQFPSLSPDGKLLVFAWAGDLWLSPSNGGIATRLTAHPAEERRSAFSPDGKWLAFESSREGARNIYVAPLSGGNSGPALLGAAARITVSDQAQSLGSFSADGKAVLFSSSRDPSVYRGTRMYRVELVSDTGSGGVRGGAVSQVGHAFGSTPRAAGGQVLFVRNTGPLERPKYRGSGNTDIYSVDAASGAFTRLTAFDGTDTEPWPGPDGSVVYISSRDGQNNVWMLPRIAPGVDPVQLTQFAPTPEQITLGHGVRDLAVSGNGRMAAFVVWDTMYTLELSRGAGARPVAVAVRAAGDSPVLEMQPKELDKEVSEQALSPDGKTLAVVARGEVFVRSTQEGFPTRRVTDTPGRERDLAWSPDGKLLYFASDDAGLAGGVGTPGIYGIFAASVVLAREDLNPDKTESSESKNAEPRNEQLPRVEGRVTDQSQPVEPPPAVPPGAGASGPEPSATAPVPANDGADKPKAALDKKETKPDHGKRWSESLTFSVAPVVPRGAEDARSPLPSPDGKKLVYTRQRGDLILRELGGDAMGGAGGAERVLLKSWDKPEVVWAADSRHLVYSVSDLDYNSDIWLLDTQPEQGDGKPNPVNLTRHPDLDASPRLSQDGKVLTFLSERGGENGEFDVYQIYLDKSLESMTSYERDEYFKKAGEAAGKRRPLGATDKKDAKKDGEKAGDVADAADRKDAKSTESKPLKFDASDAYLRVRRLVSIPGAEGSLAVTPGADRVIFSASGDSAATPPERTLLSVDHKGGDRKTLQAGGVSDVGVSLTGDKVVFIAKGSPSWTAAKGGGKVEGLPISAPVVIDVVKQQQQKFLEAAKLLGTGFYHHTLKGLDWPGLTRRYLSLIERTRTNEEFNRVTLMLFNELDGSHLGVMGGSPLGAPSAASPAIGYLGVATEPAGGGYRVLKVHRQTPGDAAEAALRLNVGDVIIAIDGQRLAPDEASLPTLDLDAAMLGKAGKETLVQVRRADAAPAADGKPRVQTLLMVPITAAAWDDAQYWDEVEDRRQLVDKRSGGKLGYLHVRAMGEAAVRDFERDLFAAAGGKAGLIIDVRDNGGGSTADILLASLTAPRHAWTSPRGPDPATVPHDSYPRDRRLIYGWTRPINVLINQNSFSNAEIFAHAIKTIGRGKLIGTATFGGVISTGAASLIDGTIIRMPERGWYLPDGTDMENHGAQPDVSVPQMPDDEAAGVDKQLEAAVTELLGRIGS